MGDRVKDPLIELLAIALYESSIRQEKKTLADSWLTSCEEDREIYRRIARGEEDLA